MFDKEKIQGRKEELQRRLDEQKGDNPRWGNIDKARGKWGLQETVQRLGLTGSWLAGAQRRQAIDDQWHAVTHGAWRKMHSGERRMLYDILDDTELLERMIGGTFRADTHRLHKHRGIAVATSKRVLFLDKGLLGSTEIMDMPYRNVETITYSKGMFAGGIAVTGRGMASFRIEDILEKESLQPFADCVRVHVDQAQTPTSDVSTSMRSSLDDLERLASLAEKGILTPEEFAAKKQQLLGI